MRAIPVLLAASLCTGAAVQKVNVVERSALAGGRDFGNAGAYEEIRAEARFAVDPALPANRIIVDLGLAPRNSNGLVEFSADVVVMRPRDPAKANGTVLVEIPNRGSAGPMIGTFNRRRQGEPYGDGLLMRQGYTLVWIGWQWDVPNREGLLRLRAPVARGEDGKPVRGLVRAQFVPDKSTTEMPLGDRQHIAYAPVEPEDPKLILTVRDTPTEKPAALPRASWRFSESLQRIVMDAGFEAGRIYEISYRAEDPVVAGLGPAAIRDFVSFLKYGSGVETSLSEQRGVIKRSLGFGISQSGRFLRQFVYDGFNADEKGRRVFDGMWAHVAGAGRGDFNLRFAQASRDGHARLNLFYPVDLFPFTDLPHTDAISGRTGGLLDRAVRDGVVPKWFQTAGSYEYWGRGGSLIHTTPDGRADAPLPRTSRVYFIAGTQHGAAQPSARNGTQYATNPADYRWAMRALLLAMESWLRDGAEPPPSMFPRIADGTLVTPAALRWPKSGGPRPPDNIYIPHRLDFGPRFWSAGIKDTEPPAIGAPWPVLVPQVDADGNEIAGIRLPHLAAPVGSYTGWNPRAPELGAPGAAADLVGSLLPFAETEAHRRASGDTRRSLAERYRDLPGYLGQVDAAAGELVRARLLLEEDRPRVRDEAETRWNRMVSR